ncbi:hypothetical protein [Caldalkalibacillus salinus]|nr:hypothetical protein [Caldalkalibacillus salinus]
MIDLDAALNSFAFHDKSWVNAEVRHEEMCWRVTPHLTRTIIDYP